MRHVVIAMLSLAACDARSASVPREPSPTKTALVDVEPTPPAVTQPAPAPNPSAVTAPSSPATTTRQVAGGGCDPMPKEGAPCSEDDGYCVESWGTPGGHSSALWCRGGRWEREEEANLP